MQDTTLGISPPILSTELSTEIVGNTEILFRNGGLGGNCGGQSAMSDRGDMDYYRDDPVWRWSPAFQDINFPGGITGGNSGGGWEGRMVES